MIGLFKMPTDALSKGGARDIQLEAPLKGNSVVYWMDFFILLGRP